MIYSDKDIVERLNAPNNLMNRLRERSTNPRNSAMGLFGINKSSGNSDFAGFANNADDAKDIKISREATEPEPSFNKPFNPFAKTTPAPITPTESKEASSSESKALVPAAPQAVSIDDLVDNAEGKIQLADAYNESLGTLVDSVKLMRMKLDDIKPDKLPSVIAATSRVVESIRRERSDAAKNNRNQSVHLHFYTPERKKMTDYEVIDVAS